MLFLHGRFSSGSDFIRRSERFAYLRQTQKKIQQPGDLWATLYLAWEREALLAYVVKFLIKS